MFAINLTWDQWSATASNEQVQAHPTEHDIHEAIARLDGRTYTLVIAGGPEPAHIAVGGGPEKYVVYATFDNQRFHNLVVGDKCNEMQPLVVGGQRGDYPLNTIVSRAQALAAVRTFAEHGKLESTLGWQ
jgi:hypothetical protein